MSFVFFDTETTGLKRGFDQILHFAAIRTDANLNEVARFETRSRLQPHVLPHPLALRTNGLPIEWLTDACGLTADDAYLLCSLTGDLRIVEVVDAGVWNVAMTVPQAVFDGDY